MTKDTCYTLPYKDGYIHAYYDRTLCREIIATSLTSKGQTFKSLRAARMAITKIQKTVSYPVLSVSYSVLSLDVWGNQKDGYEINQWFNTGVKLTLAQCDNNKKIISALKRLDMLTKGLHFIVEDDGYNFVVLHKATLEPLYFIEYGGVDHG